LHFAVATEVRKHVETLAFSHVIDTEPNKKSVASRHAFAEFVTLYGYGFGTL
jgi:hypothetical protein